MSMKKSKGRTRAIVRILGIVQLVVILTMATGSLILTLKDFAALVARGGGELTTSEEFPVMT